VNKGLLTLLRAVAVGLAASLAVSVLVAWVLSRRVLGPIDALKDAAAALGRGEPVQLPKMNIAELNDVAVALTHAAADRNRAGAQVEDALRVAEDANRSKDQFLAMLGHELRNPLAPITTALRLMELKGDATTAPERRVIGRQLVHVTRLVDDLLDVSRITGRRLSIRRVPVRLAEVLEQVVQALQPSLDKRELSLDLAPGVDDAWVSGDEVRLVQIFNNLLVNAVKFTHPGQSIRVRASIVGEQVRVEVEDTGVGIGPDQIGRIFELFYQAPQSLDRARGGLGLGLPIVSRLVEMHGGTVQAASGGFGCGTRMTVTLPLCETPATSRPVELAQAAHGAGRVLVVDDNHDAADTCAALLEMSGYTVRVAYAPETALQMLGHFWPDVAVLDIGLPGMSGYALAGLMRAAPIGYNGRLVALTGYGQAGDKAASLEAGFDVHLTKPVSPEALLEVIEQFSSSAGTLS
nr:ATP-binding protein [Pseudomonadota bacterium]